MGAPLDPASNDRSGQRFNRMQASLGYIPNAWDQAELLRAYTQDDHPLIERPEPVEDLCRPLSEHCYEPCPLCPGNSATCPCDPDAVEAAVWARFQRGKAA